jgi:hypothetical protein
MTTASYANHLAPGESAPTCFLDANHLLNPDTSATYDLTVNVATRREWSEVSLTHARVTLTRAEVSDARSHPRLPRPGMSRGRPIASGESPQSA